MWAPRLFLLLALLLTTTPPGALGRTLRESQTAEPPNGPRLPGSAVPGADAGPSPLLDAPPVDGWQPVLGASPVVAGGTGAGSDMKPRIINGDIDKDMVLFPYAAYISWKLNSTASALCSGSLISPSHVLTAAHCLEDNGRDADPTSLAVNIRGTWHKVAASYRHERYNHLQGYMSQPSNDIGIIVLARPAPGPTVRLPRLSGGGLLGGAQAAASIPAPHEKVWAAGFGQTETGESSDVLRYTDLTVLTESQSERGFADNFAAGGPSGRACHGDSGGPIIRPSPKGDVVVGITSFGTSTDCSKPYSFFVRTAYHLDWIAAKMALPIPTTPTLPGVGAAAKPGISKPVAAWLSASP